MIPLTDLNFGALEIIYLIIVFVIGFSSTYFIIPYLIKFMKKKGYIGYDIHKNARPAVAESGGLSMVLGVSIASIFLMFFFPIIINEIIIFILTVISAGIIGFIDDRLRLRSRYKIVLTLFAGSIIFIGNYFQFIQIKSPTIPFLGSLRISILYPFAVPLILTVFANTVNMLEGYNGEGSGTCLIATCFLLVCGIIWNSAEAVIFAVPVIAVIIPFFLFNKFPAKIFPGDVGTLSMGTMIACIMLFGSLEAAAFCALLIHIFNSFYVITSVRGFFESSEIHDTEKDDIILLEDDRIKASDKKGARLTLPRLILAKGPLAEPELTKNFFTISIICGFFSIIITLLMLLTNGDLSVPIVTLAIIIVSLVLTPPTVFLLYRFPRIRGTIALMSLLIVLGCFFLIFIDLFIMPLPLADLNLIIVRIPANLILSFLLIAPGLLVWYYVSIKYFFYEIKKMKQKSSITS